MNDPLGKPHWNSCPRHFGIALIVFAPPSPALKRALWGCVQKREYVFLCYLGPPFDLHVFTVLHLSTCLLSHTSVILSVLDPQLKDPRKIPIGEIFSTWPFEQEICLQDIFLSIMKKVKVCHWKVNNSDFWRQKVSDKFDLVWSNNLGITNHRMAMEQSH